MVPDKPGYYWVRDKHGEEFVSHVVKHYTGLVAYRDALVRNVDMATDWEWLGPVEPYREMRTPPRVTPEPPTRRT